MARYIDADALIEMCKRQIECEWNTIAAPSSWADAFQDFSDLVEQAPAADVAPRSEVAREIFEKIESLLTQYTFEDECGYYISLGVTDEFAELKKKYTDPVHCKDCQHLMFSDCYGECSKGHKGIVKPDDSCKYGVKKNDTQN